MGYWFPINSRCGYKYGCSLARVVIFMSFMGCFFTIVVLLAYIDILSYALLLVVLFSNGALENMVRWYWGFSIISIGLYFILKDSNKDGSFKVVICRALLFDNRQESWPLMMLSFFLSFCYNGISI